ncbi:cadherin-like beta sandwich domain-containing protein [Haloarcula onubensis]|uniref:Cadherin-like beta sandwich domain-containing protein n=1 Tax=Haloarcula onubensis TaxID=2950539 RepID=A0ABU2FQE0_9EURY|nr:cadherin-like beta sandwich domain-containing protein [Halomicroarcula sp. S3CR25-11]MDS0282634.1 cadherin-like beta sandwich domain-containing protein [Halomicroarcula sp. S3CR25-11]
MFDISTRPLLTVFVAGLLVFGAGCAGLGASESATTPSATDTTTAQQTQTSTATDGHGHDHSHSHDGTESTQTTATNTTGDAATGKLTVVVAADELSLPARDEAGDGFDVAGPHTWESSADLTLATALSRLGISATGTALSVDGETYTAGDGTTLSYRVNGESVDPEAVTLADGDEVWVTVETPGMNASLPGTYIDNEQQHIHGDMTVTVDGEEVDFSQSRYQSNDRYFHFEGGVGEYWHSHSANLTLEYALDSLHGVDYADDSLTIDGTTDDAETTVTYEVNGEAVDPGEYHLKDGDDVTITVG